ncbi:uncharacterized protein LOC130717555 [Lotus japonicus]|uniref:uncharacterized protein LOC130717555 n=1 Tax=Lotus japonicus TaxID=34305 RepID=UPI002590AAB8|nr:uncharacterized protein LOC130717555 [Lotus japonicus]
MIILSFNSRGLGSFLKQKAIQGLISQHKADFVCIQETKLQVVDVHCCRTIWGDVDFDWRFAPSENRGGGLLCIWRKGLLQVERSIIESNFICIVGSFGVDAADCAVLNVYAPCDRVGKRQLWSKLVELKINIHYDLWCVAGDFNVVRSSSERRGVGANSQQHRSESVEFNDFIDEMELLDIPLLGRKFTWVRPNGLQMSRLDRFLISPGWLNRWPDYVQEVLQRDILDHCPLLFKRVNQNWGPKPFRVLNCWFDDPRFQAFVGDSWREIQVEGRGIIALNEKLKTLKLKLKQWNLEVFGNLHRRKKEIVDQLNDIEKKAEESDLQEVELRQRQELGAEFWQCSKRIDSLAYQKSRINWIREGDQNSRYFHAIVNFRRKVNALPGLWVEDVWVDDPSAVKFQAKEFFACKFKSMERWRPKLNGVPFRSLSVSSSKLLEENFSAAELKEAVWSCAGDKSPGPDGINFRFIKSF